MTESLEGAEHTLISPTVRAGQGLSGERRSFGVANIDIKLTMEDGRLLVLENTLYERGGPGRHLHHEQEEWFYVIEGEFAIEVGQKRTRLMPGDSLLAPRKVPHAWAYLGGSARGRILIAFTPAGAMEAFFREAARTDSMPRDPEIFRAHGMELVGPPLSLEPL